MTRVIYDLDVLRSFSTGIALGSYARAADRLGRSPSAVSAQLKKLESQAGTALFRKAGRGLALTDAGETLLAYAHRLLDLNDEAAAAVGGADLHGRLRLGLQEDLGEAVLPAVLGRFARAHPKVRIEACVSRSADLLEQVELGRLDLALVWDVGNALGESHTEPILRLPLQWIGPASESATEAPWWPVRRPSGARNAREALPLVLLDAPCPLRALVTETLTRAKLPWRHAFTSASLAAVWAATSAGLGLAVRTTFGLPANVRAVDRAGTCLPALPGMTLSLCRPRGEAEPSVQRLSALLVEAIRTHAQGHGGV